MRKKQRQRESERDKVRGKRKLGEIEEWGEGEIKNFLVNGISYN